MNRPVGNGARVIDPLHSLNVLFRYARAGLVKEAMRQGKAYFKDTNVVLYGVAALHDRDAGKTRSLQFAKHGL